LFPASERKQRSMEKGTVRGKRGVVRMTEIKKQKNKGQRRKQEPPKNNKKPNQIKGLNFKKKVNEKE